MDLPRFVAMYVKDMSGIPAEAEPSPADMPETHFIVRVENFWQEPEGTFMNFNTGDYSFEENGIPVEGFRQALPIRLVFHSRGTGEIWRARMIEQTRRNATLFSTPFRLDVMGGRLMGPALDMMTDGQGVDISNIDELNEAGPGIGMIVELSRDPGKDVVFEKDLKMTTRLGKVREKSFGYICEQHFVGNIVFDGGDEVPNDKRRFI